VNKRVTMVFTALLCLAYAITTTPAFAQSDSENLSQHPTGASSSVAESCFDCHDPVVQPKFDEVALKFGSSLNKVHFDAGVTCDSCHAKHEAKNLTGARPTIEACAKCHTALVDAYKNGEHFAAFRDLGFPHCATCHDVHAPTDAVTTDLTSPQEQGLESTRATCLSCHFTGSEYERTIFNLEATLDETDKVCGKLDVSIAGFSRLNSTLLPLIKVKTDPIPDGGYYRAMARAQLHGVGNGVDTNLSNMHKTLEETAHLTGVAFARVFAFYVTLILLALIVIIHNLRKAARRRLRYRLSGGVNSSNYKE
jgi:hypothetical protein